MKLLAIETATELCSAALAIDDDCRFQQALAPRQHTALILPMVDQLLQEADIKIQDLDAIAFGQGPGAFTGVRIAISVVQGLAYAHSIPVIPISTLAALAQQFAAQYDHVAAAMDARIKEVYFGLYQKNQTGLMQAVTTEQVCSPAAIEAVPNAKWFGVGSAWTQYAATLEQKLSPHLIGFEATALPCAKEIIELAAPALLKGDTVAVEKALPVYLRDQVVHHP